MPDWLSVLRASALTEWVLLRETENTSAIRLDHDGVPNARVTVVSRRHGARCGDLAEDGADDVFGGARGESAQSQIEVIASGGPENRSGKKAFAAQWRVVPHHCPLSRAATACLRRSTFRDRHRNQHLLRIYEQLR